MLPDRLSVTATAYISLPAGNGSHPFSGYALVSHCQCLFYEKNNLSKESPHYHCSYKYHLLSEEICGIKICRIFVSFVNFIKCMRVSFFWEQSVTFLNSEFCVHKI